MCVCQYAREYMRAAIIMQLLILLRDSLHVDIMQLQENHKRKKHVIQCDRLNVACTKTTHVLLPSFVIVAFGEFGYRRG